MNSLQDVHPAQPLGLQAGALRWLPVGGGGDEEAPAPPVTVFLQQMAAVVGGTWWQAWRASALSSLTADSHGEKPLGTGWGG